MNRIRRTARPHIFLIFFIFFCFSVLGVLPTFSSTPSAPQLKFTKWKAGQGQEYTASNPPHTFITDTETTCEITATVAYASSQPSSVYPLTGYTWQVTGSHGYTFTTQTETSGPVGQTGTTFTLTATGTGNQHNSSSGGHRPMRGRSEKPIKFTVKFIGQYGSGSGSDPQTVEVEVVFEQDEKDQMRQEYLDSRRLHETHRSADVNATYGDLRVPGRGAFTKSGQRFNDGHYSYLINKNLEDKILHWWQACDKVAYEDLDNDDLRNDRGNKELRLTGGYRNPHHHVYHVYAGKPASKIKYWSLHQFGLALDVGAMDMDGESGITNLDRAEMRDAARDHAGASYAYYAGHVHAQWGAVRNAPGGTSTSSQRSTQTSTTNTENPVPTPPETTPTTVRGACGTHTISTSQAANHASVNFACGSHSYYACQTPSTSAHALQASCSSTDSNGNSCTVTNFYACDSHTHAYPSAQLRQCGRHTKAEGGDHTYISVCSATNADGASCQRTSIGYWACDPHTHLFPAAMRQCGQHTKAEGGDHRFLRCSACNGPHWSCNATSVDRHRLRTCRYGTCGNTWRRCQSSTPNCSSPNRPGKKCWAQ